MPGVIEGGGTQFSWGWILPLAPLPERAQLSELVIFSWGSSHSCAVFIVWTRLIAVFALVTLTCSCSGTKSAIKEGYAFQMTEDETSLLRSAPTPRATGCCQQDGWCHQAMIVFSPTLKPTLRLRFRCRSSPPMASRLATEDRCSLFNRPSKAARIHSTIIERATLLGRKVSPAEVPWMSKP